MEHSVADLLTDAFSETPLPSSCDGVLDFENLQFDEMAKGRHPEEKPREVEEEDEILQNSLWSRSSEANVANVDGKGDKDKAFSQDEGGRFPRCEENEKKIVTEAGGEREDLEAGRKARDRIATVCRGGELWDGADEDGDAAERPLTPEAPANPEVRNQEREGESQGGEDMSYFGQFPQRGAGMSAQGDRLDEEERATGEGSRDDSDPDYLAVRFPGGDKEGEAEPSGDYCSHTFCDALVQNLQQLLSEGDMMDESADKIQDFSGADHQGAGESIAEYPSDLSSCEYAGDETLNEESGCDFTAVLPHPGGESYRKTGRTEMTPLGRAVSDEDDEEQTSPAKAGMEVKPVGQTSATGEAVRKDQTHTKETTSLPDGLGDFEDADSGLLRRRSETDIYSSSDDEIQARKRGEDPQLGQPPAEAQGDCADREVFAARTNREDLGVEKISNSLEAPTLSISSDTHVSTGGALWSEDSRLETKDGALPSQRAKDVWKYQTDPAVQDTGDILHVTNYCFNQECAEDGEGDAWGITELGHFGDDEYEEERNWEQEQERIKAFYEFYNDGKGGKSQEGRKIKVQFCKDLLPQVIPYDSVGDAYSSEEDVNPKDMHKEPMESETQRANADLHSHHKLAPGLCSTPLQSTTYKCLGILKVMLETAGLILLGLLMLWWATDQSDWLGRVPFF